jgi:hypothetical protein
VFGFVAGGGFASPDGFCIGALDVPDDGRWLPDRVGEASELAVPRAGDHHRDSTLPCFSDQPLAVNEADLRPFGVVAFGFTGAEVGEDPSLLGFVQYRHLQPPRCKGSLQCGSGDQGRKEMVAFNDKGVRFVEPVENDCQRTVGMLSITDR